MEDKSLPTPPPRLPPKQSFKLTFEKKPEDKPKSLTVHVEPEPNGYRQPPPPPEPPPKRYYPPPPPEPPLHGEYEVYDREPPQHFYYEEQKGEKRVPILIEKTSKDIKAMILAGEVMVGFGFITLCAGAGIAGALLMFSGLVISFVGYVQRWWHHA